MASIVTLMPPASYGAPAMRAANSAERSPANTRWVWLSTNPGITQRPPTSIRSSAAGAAPGAHGDDAIPVEHDVGVGQLPDARCG